MLQTAFFNNQTTRLYQQGILVKKDSVNKGLPSSTTKQLDYIQGGIGLCKTEATNIAFPCKLAWKILTDNESTWVRNMRNKYLINQHFFRYNIRQGDSTAWRNIMKCRDLVQKGMVWSVGNGNDIFFGYDNWIENICLIELLNMADDIQPNPQTKVSEFIHDRK